VSNYWY